MELVICNVILTNIRKFPIRTQIKLYFGKTQKSQHKQDEWQTKVNCQKNEAKRTFSFFFKAKESRSKSITSKLFSHIWINLSFK